MFAHLQVHMQMENHYSLARKGASYKEVHIYGIFQQRSNRFLIGIGNLAICLPICRCTCRWKITIH